VTGDLGNSAAGCAQGSELPIWDDVDEKLRNSADPRRDHVVIMIPLAILFGVWAALRAGRPVDHGISVSSLAVISLPEFVIGSILILIFFSWLDLLPGVSLIRPGTNPLSEPDKLVLPVLTLLGVTTAASIAWSRGHGRGPAHRVRADGPSERLPRAARRGRYARNALAPSVQVFAQNIQFLIGGIIVTEYLFAYPGIAVSSSSGQHPRHARGGVARRPDRRDPCDQHRRRPPGRAARAEAEDRQ
jgi:peptide/nickel transport system permease protein